MDNPKSLRQQYPHLYRSWFNIRQRCDNPNATGYKAVGGKGIRYDREWKDFEYFLDDILDIEGYEEGLVLNRKDISKNFEKDNMRWATPKQRSRNASTNTMLTLGDGETKCMAEWAEFYKIPYVTFCNRVKRGVTGEALISPASTAKEQSIVKGVNFNNQSQRWVVQRDGIHLGSFLKDDLDVAIKCLEDYDATGKPNKRYFKSIEEEIDGEVASLSAWAKRVGMSRQAIHSRYKKGVRGKDLLGGRELLY